MRACVFVSIPRLTLASGMIWTPHDWVNKLYNFYIHYTIVDMVEELVLAADKWLQSISNVI